MCKARGFQGFSLIEMVVVITIVTIVTAIVLANLPGFRDNTSIELAAQQMATIIREAQVYGIAQKKTPKRV